MEDRKYKVGEIVVLENNHSCMEYTFYAGQAVRVTGYTSKGYEIVDGLGRSINECGWDL